VVIKKKPDYYRTNIYFPIQLREKMRKYEKKTNRSFSQLLAMIVEKYLEENNEK